MISVAFAGNQKYSIQGKVLELESKKPIDDVEIFIEGVVHIEKTTKTGEFKFSNLAPGVYILNYFKEGYQGITQRVDISVGDQIVEVSLEKVQVFKEVVLESNKDKPKAFGSDHLKSVEDMAIYESKKTEVVNVTEVVGNKAGNNSREIYSKVAGLNIWESDCAGLQLDIGGRGLSPKRTASFNVRQNGYDISADALGYPESYYTPPAEVLEKIEVVRGASSLQYGTQIGGMVNYVMKKPSDSLIEFVTRQSVGSYKYINSSNMVSGTKGKFSYLGYYHYKSGDGCANRPNSHFDYHMVYSDLAYKVNDKWKLRLNYTFMNYLAQQPGGLTDKQFENDPTVSTRNRNWFSVKWHLPAFYINHEITKNAKVEFRTFGLIAARESLGDLTRIDRPDPLGNRNLISGEFKNIGQEGRFLQKYTAGEKSMVFLLGYRAYLGTSTNLQGNANKWSGADFYYTDPADSLGSNYLNNNKNLAFFSENIVRLNDHWSFTPGVRYEYINTESDGYYKRELKQNGQVIESTLNNEKLSRKRSVLLFGLGISNHLNHNHEAYANISQNYKSITFADMRIVNPSFRIDPNMKDEKGYSADLGVRGNFDQIIRYDFSVFYLRYYDRIGDILVTNDSVAPPYRLRTNISDSRNIGFESLIEYRLLRSLGLAQEDREVNLFANTSVTNAIYINSKEAAINGKQVELVPPVTLKLGVNVRLKAFELSYLFTSVAQHFTDATNAVQTADAVGGIIPAYSVMDLGLAYNFKMFRLETGCNNLLDNSYYTRRASSYPGPGIIPASRRTFYVSLQFKIN